MWRRWIYDDYYRSYLVPLEKYGLTIPHDLVEEAWNRIWTRATSTRSRSSSPPAGSPTTGGSTRMTDKDFEWFEHKYPGWYNKYGKWWENYNRLAYPVKNGHKPIAFEPRPTTVPAPLLDLHGAVPDP